MKAAITGPSKRVLYIASLNHAVNDGSVFLLSSLFPIVLGLFSLTVLQIGILVGTGYFVAVILQPSVGRYSEGRDPRKLLALGIGIITASILSFVVSTGFYTLLISVLLLRVGSSFYHPVGVSAVSRTYSGSGLERAMGFQSAFGNLGIFLVFVLAAPVYLSFGWQATFVLFAFIGIGDILITLFFFKKSRAADARRADPTPNHNGGLLGIPIFFAATTFISGGAYAVIVNYGNIYLESTAHLGVSTSNVLVASWIGFAFIGAITTGRWSRNIRRDRLLSLTFLAASLSIIGFSIAGSSLAIVIPLLLVNGFVLSATYPLTYSELTDHINGNQGTSGRAFGVIFSAQTVGGSVLGLMSGYVSAVYGLPVAFAIVGFLCLVGSGVALAWARGKPSIGATS